MIKSTTMVAVLSILMLQKAARAEADLAAAPPRDGRKWGDASTVAISGDFSLAIRRFERAPYPSNTSVMVHPALDYFLADHLSVGGGLGVGYSGATYGSEIDLSVGPRVGYDLPLGDRFSVWPMAGVTYVRTTWSFEGPAAHDWTLNGLASADLIAHIAPHFFMGFGPYVTDQLAGSAQITPDLAYGFASTLGGWL